MSYFLVTVSRKILAIVIAAVQSLLGALGIYVDLGGVHAVGSEISYTFEYSTEKVFQTDFIDSESTFTMHLAKNEREDCQLVVRNRSSEDKTVAVIVDSFTNGTGGVLPYEVFEVRYIAYEPDTDIATAYPDALVPYGGESVTISGHSNQSFFIEVRSNDETPAGNYSARVTITDLSADGEELVAETRVSADVWDFTLPNKPSCVTAMGISSANFFKLNGIDRSTAEGVAEGSKLYKQYYDFLLDHKVSAYSLPYDVRTTQAEEYMNDERVTSFNIGYSAGNTEYLTSIYNRVSSNELWKSKSFFYPIDEPKTEEAYDSYHVITSRLGEYCEGYNMVTPFNTARVLIDGKLMSSVELQNGKSNIMCPVSDLLSNKDVLSRYKARQADGDKAWWYVCCKPVGTYCNLHMCNDGLCHRILFWQQKSLGIEGLLYWNTVYWDKCGNPWENAKTWNAFAPGDGSLMYPGRIIGIDEPIASVRLKGVTNGIEDFEYFTIAEELLGNDYMNAVIDKVTTSLTVYTNSDELFERVRTELGNAIEAELCKIQ